MIQKHVGIDLEAQIPKIKKMTPLQSFLLVFLVPRGAEKHEKSRKNDSKMRTKIYRFFQPILKRFLLDFPPIWDPKISKSQPKSHAKSKQKNHLKLIPKISILASKMCEFFLLFWLPKSTLGGALGPSGRPNRKSPPKLAKSHPSYEKMTLK